MNSPCSERLSHYAAAYHSKYSRYGTAAVGLAVSAASRAATVKINPTES